MNPPIQTETIELSGREFEVRLYADDDSSPPWEREDGHGPVRFISDRETLARGETILHDCRSGRYVYGFGQALMQASRDGWGLAPDALDRLTRKLGKKPTKGQVRAQAVRADMDYLRGWCADDWSYVGVCVRIIGADGDAHGNPYKHAVWGIESCGDYWREVALELADEILDEKRKAWRAHLRETREVIYWQSRDVQTLGA